MDILILYCCNIKIFISYCHNMRESIPYGLYCNILLYCHIISNTDPIFRGHRNSTDQSRRCSKVISEHLLTEHSKSTPSSRKIMYYLCAMLSSCMPMLFNPRVIKKFLQFLSRVYRAKLEMVTHCTQSELMSLTLGFRSA
jgi:hypothetical protein